MKVKLFSRGNWRYHRDTIRYARYGRIAILASCFVMYMLDCALCVICVRHRAEWAGAFFALVAIFFALYGTKLSGAVETKTEGK